MYLPRVSENRTPAPAPAAAVPDVSAVPATITALLSAALNANGISDIVHLREAEKTERDLFRAFYTRYPSVAIFNTL